MRRIRIMASRLAWLGYCRTKTANAFARYKRVEAHELQRNGTDTYTPYWAA